MDVANVRIAGVQRKLWRKQRIVGLILYVGLDITGGLCGCDGRTATYID